MAEYVELQVPQHNDPQVELAVTQDGAPFDLDTASAVEMYLKPHRTTEDTHPDVVKLAVGSGLTVSDAAAGVCVATIPASALNVAGPRWWRLDLVVSGRRRTSMFGVLLVDDV